MDINSGRLVADLNSISEEDRRHFTPVPNRLLAAALAMLAGQAETTVNVRQRSPITDWARSERKRQKNRARNKISKRSRAASR